ncbi:tripartite tricarboxylate transporter TctB family protein [Ancylobacter sp.]|uniref:tripartite tricarboxylate transporter TctB family protein n=1 Tax=Ancylobacter sp. TaxID=1872567 RepID=UPI003C7EB816
MTTTDKERSRNDLYVGAIFIILALFFGSEARHYDLGAGGQVGPGLFPVVLSVLLFALGVAIGLQHWSSHSEHHARAVPWRAIVLVCLSLFLFGYASDDLGLVPVVFLCTALTALSSTQNSLAAALAIAAVMSLLCFAVFKLGLGINLPSFGPVFGR